MTATWKKWGLLALTFFIFGFKGNELIELEGYLNARSSANFLKSTGNVKFVLPPGTKARIQESKTFGSGNSGLLVEVLDGPKKGEQVWVYYNESNPTMKLYKDEASAKEDKPTKKVAEATQAKTTKDTPAIRAPASTPKSDKKYVNPPIRPASNDIQKMIGGIEKGNQSVKELGKPGGPCADCDVKKVYQRDVDANREITRASPVTTSPKTAKAVAFEPKSSQDTPRYQTPSRTQNPHGVRSQRCGSPRGTPYQECVTEGESVPSAFKFSNYGPNSVVPVAGETNSRDWQFSFEGHARQDIYFSITDSHSGRVSQLRESYFMIFPRTTVPTIRVEGNKQIVTLPNGETVTYDVRSKQIIGGVLSENGSVGAQPARVSYGGNGVMLRVDAVGKDPRIGTTATITKQGKTCRVPASKLWPNQSASSAMHFKYFSDADFDAFLKQTCGFGM